MKRILLVSYFFAPQNEIAAVRATKLAKYWTRQGHEVTVLCGAGTMALKDPILERDLKELGDVRVIRERNLIRDRAKKKAETRKAEPATPENAPQNAGNTWKHRLADFVYILYGLHTDRSFYRAAVRAMRGEEKPYDVVFSTYGPHSSHLTARKLKRMGVAKRWIADFRDEASLPFSWLKPFVTRFVAMVRREADAITGVSAGYLGMMGYQDVGRVLTNGYDPDDVSGMNTDMPRNADKLTFIHCGQMYGSKRDLGPLFSCLRELIDAGEMDGGRIRLSYAGRDADGFARQAEACGMGAQLDGHGFVPRDQSLRLQLNAQVLLLAAWNYRDRFGNLPGKLLEYMMLCRPVICCTAGDLAGSEVARIMERTGIGFCYEQANAGVDRDGLKDYLRALYQAFIRGERIPYEPNVSELEKFAYPTIAAGFTALMEKME